MANLVVHFEIHASEPQQLGGTEALAAADMQGVGRVGYLLDPDNNVFGLISAVMSDGTTGMGGG